MKRLEQRAMLLKQLRRFFDDRGFIEVETPLLSVEVIPEQHIDLFSASPPNPPPNSRGPTGRRAWLQASPELHMKRLIAQGMQAIYQVTRSFRAEEQGALHHPEFTIVEWYRTGDDMHAGIDLLDALCQTLLQSPTAIRTSYAEAFQKHAGVCPHTSSVELLAARTAALGLSLPDTMDPGAIDSGDRDQWLNLLLAMQVEPQLGRDVPEILYDYPTSQAALANIVTRPDGISVAARFELYWQGVELANGYDELTDAEELRHRLETVNRSRRADGKETLPLPESLLTAMKKGLPCCAGCALGFDRLVLLATGATTLKEVTAYCLAQSPGVVTRLD